MRRKRRPTAVFPVSQRLAEIAAGEPLNWPTDDTPASAQDEAAASAENRLRGDALRAQAEQRNQPNFFL